jgi:hypothetical protein
MIKMREQIQPGETPEKITVSMIDQDLKDGISKPEMAIKYGIKPWEVDEMFKHPLLKGRRPSRKKKLSFSFVDDMPSELEEITVDGGEIEVTIEVDPNQDTIEEAYGVDKTSSILDIEATIDPNQITLDQAIDEAIIVAEEVKDQMQQTQDAILDMLSPTEFETPEETLLKDAQDTPEITGIPNGDTMSDIDDAEEVEEEIEMDDNTFEL